MLEQTLIKWRGQIEKETRQDTLLKLMTVRFGRLPEEVRGRVQQVTSTRELDRLTRKILSAKSLQDMGLG